MHRRQQRGDEPGGVGGLIALDASGRHAFGMSKKCDGMYRGYVTENVEVFGSHSGLGFNMQVLWIVADRLAQPAGGWRTMNHVADTSYRWAISPFRALEGVGLP